MAILRRCRWSFHAKKLCSRLCSIKIEFYSKSLFEPPFGGLKSNVSTLSTAHWKALVDFLFVIIINFFTISFNWDVISGNLSNSAFFEGVGHFERKFQTEGSVAHHPLLVSEDWSDCPTVLYQNIHNVLFSFCHKARTDGQTDRPTELRLPRPR